MVERAHLCAYDQIRTIARYRSYRWIREMHFEAWFNINSLSYCIATSPKLDNLWTLRKDVLSTAAAVDDRFRLKMSSLINDVLQEYDINNVIAVLVRATRTEKKIRTGTRDQPIAPSDMRKSIAGRRKSQTHTGLFDTYICANHPDAPKSPRVHIRLKNFSKLLNRPHFKVLNRLFPYSSAADKAKTNVDVASIVYHACKSGKLEVVNVALSMLLLGSLNITVCAVLIHALGNEHFDTMYKLVKKDAACCMSPAVFHDYFKSITTALRRTIRWYDGTPASISLITSASYWEMCMGRANNVSDWKEEISKRTQHVVYLRPLTEPGPATVDTNRQYVQQLCFELDLVMRELIPVTSTWCSWSEFGERRQSWVASGSAGAQFVTLDGEKVRINKPAYFETISQSQFNSMLDSEPAILASASEKFEQSKSRAIYGTMPVDYAIMAYVILPLENKFHNIDGVESSLRGLDEIACVYRRIHHISKPGVEGTMIDYSDFNYQHTLEAQSAIFASVTKRLQEIGVGDDVIKASEWCRKACLNQWCKFPGDRKPRRVLQGMFSGVRGTHFINTILNVAYYRVAKRNVAELFNEVPADIYTVHQGDDVWISNSNRLWAMLLYNCMKYNGFIFNDHKQLMALNTGEFLRVWYSEGKASGYVARAIGSLIQRPIQGNDALLPSSQAGALNEQLMILARRGLTSEATDILWQAIVPHALKLNAPSGVHVTIPLRIAKRRFLDGGLDLGPPYTAAAPCTREIPVPGITYGSNALSKVVPNETSSAWIRHMSKTVQRPFDAQAVRDNLHLSNLSGSMTAHDRVSAINTHARDLQKWITKLGPQIPDRSSDVFVIAKSSDQALTAVLDQAKHSIVSTIHSGVKAMERTDLMASIMGAIAASPFKDLATACTALKLPPLSSASIAISLCPSSALRSRGMRSLTDLQMIFDDDMMNNLLNSDFSVGSHFNCYLHPVVVSWITYRGTLSALFKAKSGRIHTIETWKVLVHDTVSSLLTAACADPFWLQISKF